MRTEDGVTRLPVEIARTAEQHRVGLSGRTPPREEGMIFLFDQVQPAGTAFWMYQTVIPLSLALLDADGVIREIIEMEPCRRRWASLCRRYRAGAAFHAALEVPAGFFESRDVTIGARVSLEIYDR